MRFGNDLCFLREQREDQLWQRKKYPRDDLPPPTDQEPVPEAFFSLFRGNGDGLNVYVLRFTLWALHNETLSFVALSYFTVFSLYSSIEKRPRHRVLQSSSFTLTTRKSPRKRL